MEYFLQKMILILIRNEFDFQYRTDYKAFSFVHDIDFNSPKKTAFKPKLSYPHTIKSRISITNHVITP